MFSPTTNTQDVGTFDVPLGKAKDADGVFFLHPKNAKFVTEQRKGGFSGMLLWMLICIVGLIIAGALVLSGNNTDERRAYLLTNGTKIRGTITELRYSSGRRSTSYYADYRYRVDGQPFTGSTSISSGQYSSTDAGDAIQIVYNRDNPSEHIIEGQFSNASAGSGTRTVGFVIGGFALLLLGLFGYLYSREQALYKNGKLVRGTLTNLGASWYRGNLTMNATFQFTTPDTGKTITKMNSAQRNDMRKRVNMINWQVKPETLPYPGSPVVVLYANERNFRLL